MMRRGYVWLGCIPQPDVRRPSGNRQVRVIWDNLLTDDSEGLRFQPDTSGLGDAITGQRVAYQRVSSLEQRVDRQLDGITFERTFTDTVSGKDTDRPQLEAMLGLVRDGDTVIVHSMDRLARNLEDLRKIVRELTAKGVQVQFLTEQLTFTGDDTAMATLLLSLIGAFAEFELIWTRRDAHLPDVRAAA